ncbi:hypothetical protein GNE08_12155 [Trichormus variabilis ARAD]|uniref:Uncharacterized protein n=1 Tax=Trichormus variabilis N2B TaxID=2681315 RepID=A0ABR6SAN5_ANAVA|nr:MULTISPECIES: hypothetical protein [Nostocaceae]MBC1214971.1 hypothetical protein [Trichormus variabilis ARAD]MBC1254729.1 hypothetical protein [Trichormus variabilis V5]MBC1266080.1 hypothetical protein [Trichormus variabilis FSR]MBC1303477.1 hypothetical protein [Trichormus variabilis N2B]MBC1312702.1 hypothetical protein [Trichormus variabilis PNB]
MTTLIRKLTYISPFHFNLGDRFHSHSLKCDRSFGQCWQGKTMVRR